MEWRTAWCGEVSTPGFERRINGPVQRLDPSVALLVTNGRHNQQIARASGRDVRKTDPFGLVLEAYDTIGRAQTHEADTGAPIDTAAEVTVDGASVGVSGPFDLMALLGASAEAQLQYVRTWIAYAYERPVSSLDECIEQELAGNLTNDGYTILDLLVDLTQTDSFRLRAPLEDGQ